MNWLTVRLPGCRLVYFPAGESVEFERVSNDSPLRRSADSELAAHPRMRRILWKPRDQDWKPGAPGWEKKSKSYGFLWSLLHWSAKVDLVELDRKVRAGDVSEQDLSLCVPAEAREISCVICGSLVGVVVASLVDGPSCLADDRRIDDHKFYRHCPACGQDSRWPLVVDFFGQDSWPEDWYIRADAT